MGVSVINAFTEAQRPLPKLAGTNPINGFLRLAIENDIDFYAAPFPPGVDTPDDLARAEARLAGQG